MLKLTKLDWWGFTFQTYLPTTRQSGQPQFLLAAFGHHHLFINRIKKKTSSSCSVRWKPYHLAMNEIVMLHESSCWKEKHIPMEKRNPSFPYFNYFTKQNPTNYFIFFFINVGVRTILRAPRLIPRVLKLTTM
jgi:hypothetical protein